MSEQISTRQGYRAMVRFLERYYELTGAPDEIGALLGGLAMDADGDPIDPAAWSDWLSAVHAVVSDQATSD